MITLTAEIIVKGENPSPFQLGVSPLGVGLLGETIDRTEVINKRNILSLESEIRERADIDKPSFGIISSGGRLSFRDTNSRFLEYANHAVLNGNEPIYIFINNTLSKSCEQVGKYLANDWDYDNDSKTLSVSIEDDLKEWQEIQVGKWELQYPKTILEIYEHLKSITPTKFNIVEKNIPSQIVSERSYCRFPYLEKGTLWSQWSKFCEIAQLFIYKDKKGNVIVSSTVV